MADLCEKVGADIHAVAKGMGLDKRIGPKFLHPGPGYGGSCFPKDTRAILELARDRGVDMQIVSSVIKVNEQRPEKMVAKILSVMDGDIAGKVVALLGLTFKPNTDDLRESPAIEIMERLVGLGARVRVYDPVGMEGAARTERSDVVYCSDEYDACEGADVLVIATEWNQFRGLDLSRISERLRGPVVVDLRNIYEPEKMRKLGFRYIGVGRK